MDRRWDKSKPPRGPFALNRDCPQAVGLVAWYPHGLSGRTYAPDMAGSLHLAGTTSAMTRSADGAPAVTLVAASSHSLSSSTRPVTGFPMTLAAWAKPSTAHVGVILGLGASDGVAGNNRKVLYWNSDSTIHMRNQVSGSSADIAASGTGTAGSWLHGAAVFAGSTDYRVFRNGANKNTSSTSISWGSPSNTLIGYDNAETTYFNGDVGECGIWSVALDDGMVWRLYDPGTRFELWYPLRSRKWFTQGAAAYTLTAAQAPCSLTGQSAGLIAARKLVAAQASFSLTGNAAGLLFGRKIAAAQASFALTGIDASLTYSPSGAYTLTAASASFSLTGNAAGLVVARKLTSDHASFALTGQSAGLTYARGIAAGTGVFTLTGIDAALSTTGTVTQTARAVGAGRSRRRRPYVVEIDGHDFVVNSEEEAAALLENAKEEAEQVARQAIERAAKVKVRPVRKVIADARKSLALPDIKAPGLEDYAAQITQHIEELYQDALRTIEIAALIAKREREDEDDEDILLLMA